MMKSIVTKYTNYCIFCGKPLEAEHHLLFGNGMRALAEQDKIKVPACNYCHNMGPVLERIHDNPMAEKLSKICGQLAYEKMVVAQGYTEEQARELFRKRYGRSYL